MGGAEGSWPQRSPGAPSQVRGSGRVQHTWGHGSRAPCPSGQYHRLWASGSLITAPLSCSLAQPARVKQSREGQACRRRLLREGGRGEPSPRDSGRAWGLETAHGAPHSPGRRLREQWIRLPHLVQFQMLARAPLAAACPVLILPGIWPSGAVPELSPRAPCPKQDKKGVSSARNRAGGRSEGSLQPCVLRALARGPQGEWDRGHAHVHAGTPVPAPRLRAAGLSGAPCAHVGMSACRFSVRGL